MPSNDIPQAPHGLMGLKPQEFVEAWQNEIWLGIVLSAILALIIYVWCRRRALRLRRLPQPLDPWEKLRSDYTGLAAPTPETAESFYVRLSALVRTAIELRFGIQASAQTLIELERSLVAIAELSEAERRDHIDFLRHADQMKFAPPSLIRESDGRWLQKVGQWIERRGTQA